MISSGRYSVLFTACLLFASNVLQTVGFDNSRSDNMAVYYGQNSYGASHPGAPGQQRLSAYCQDDVINAIPLGFLNVLFSAGGLPEINLSNICGPGGNDFPGTRLANCQTLTADIKGCQARGKIVTLSLGGATLTTGFNSDGQAQAFADTVWNLFLGGSSNTRPFGDAVLDGVDLDIESGNGAGWAAFVTRLKTHTSGANKMYYYTAAPQCPFPDAHLGSPLNAVGFHAVYIQFYNNPSCGINNLDNFNFGTWDNWAKNSKNKGTKIYIGAPADPSAAGNGYIDPQALGNLAKRTRERFSSFGGIMLWDASQAYGNNRFDRAAKAAMGPGAGGAPVNGTPPAAPPPVGTGSCAGVAEWASNQAYVGGSQVTYSAHLWTSKWWSQADTPGGVVGVWTDNGACTERIVAATGSMPNASPSAVHLDLDSEPNTQGAAGTHSRSSRFFGFMG